MKSRLVRYTFLMSLLSLAACGGGGGGGGDVSAVPATNSSDPISSYPAPTPTTAPSFTTQPTDASVVAPASATFSVAVAGSPTPALQWQLSTDDGSNWTDIAGATATSYTTPPTALADNGKRYRAIATNSAGTNASTVARLAVGKGWGPPVSLQSIGAKGMYPYGANVAFDLNGNALAVWHRYDGTIESIWASRYTAETDSWSTPEVISDQTIPHGDFPKIAFDAAGNAMAVWKVSYGSSGEIWANYYTAATGSWGIAATVDDKPYPESSRNPDFAFDGAGNVLLVWDQAANGVVSIWYNRYDAASGLWGTSKTIESDDLHHAALPKIAVDPSGNALAVWEHNDGTRNNIMANRYTASTESWGTPTLIEFDNVGYAWSPDIAVDPKGNAIAVWRQGNGIDYDAVACRYLAGTNTWGTPTLLETLADDVAYVQIVVAANGDALALWAQSLSYNGIPSIFSSRYDVVTESWSTAAVIENSNLESWYPELTIGANGNAMAIWWQGETNTSSQVTNYYDATTKTWGVAAPVETSSDPANYGAVAVAPDGTAVAIWTQSNALWASRYQQ